MLREFTKPIGRYRIGEVRDFPQPTWAQMAKSCELDLADFTKAVTLTPGHMHNQGGPVKLRKRLQS